VRHFIFALLIALLPLRGWVGDVMATQMATNMAAHAVHHADESHGSSHAAQASVEAAQHTMTADCTEHGAAAPADVVVDAHDQPDAGMPTHAAGDCPSCSACQVCHTVALSPQPFSQAASALPAATPVMAASHFASAEAAPGQKPPIS
jgi:hypothetical protein